MSAVFAEAGEPVTSEDGRIICYVKNDLHRNTVCNPDDFHRFSDGERPWVRGEVMDARCFRVSPTRAGPQICINGEWRP